MNEVPLERLSSMARLVRWARDSTTREENSAELQALALHYQQRQAVALAQIAAALAGGASKVGDVENG